MVTSSQSTYARIVGEVAIAWTELEGWLDTLIFHYLIVPNEVAGFILGEMGNATKAEFARFLINLYEDNAALSEHGLFAVTLVNRLRENRNILEHAQPYNYQDRYQGTIWKKDKRGAFKQFRAPIKDLRILLISMKEAAPYIRWIAFTCCMRYEQPFEGMKGGPQTAEAALRTLASIDRPHLPDKIGPLPPLAVLAGD